MDARKFFALFYGCSNASCFRSSLLFAVLLL